MDRLAAQLIPGSRDDRSLRILLTDHGDRRIDLLLGRILRSGEDDRPGALDLVVVELSEVLHVHLDFLDIRHSDERSDLKIAVFPHALNRVADIGQFADAGRLDNDVVRLELIHHLLQGFGEITHQAAADASGVHLRDVDARIFQETAVDADLAEFIFDQNDLLACENICDQLLDQGRLTCTEQP